MVTLTPSLLSVFVAFLFTFVVVSGQFTIFSKMELPPGVTGPESAAFPAFPRLISTDVPYFTTVSDGRILQEWLGPGTGFVDYYTHKEHCDGTTDPDKWPICGRPMALSFNPITNLLYIADAYFGLLAVGPQGGLATQLAGGFKFATGVDVDLMTGNVYITDASLTYDIRDSIQPEFVADSTGRLLRYNPFTKELSVLLDGLSGGGGPAVSADGTFVLVPEQTGNRISKYWLAGPKANQVEVLINTVGNPNKIKEAEVLGEFWVAVSDGFYPPASLITPQGIRFNSNGDVLQIVPFDNEFPDTPISLVQEHNGRLYVGSPRTDFIGVYSDN